MCDMKYHPSHWKRELDQETLACKREYAYELYSKAAAEWYWFQYVLTSNETFQISSANQKIWFHIQSTGKNIFLGFPNETGKRFYTRLFSCGKKKYITTLFSIRLKKRPQHFDIESSASSEVYETPWWFCGTDLTLIKHHKSCFLTVL